MLGVFFLPAFTRLGHECQYLLSPFDAMHFVRRLDLALYSDAKEFWGNGEPMLTPPPPPPKKRNKKKPTSAGSSAQDRTRNDASSTTASPTHYRLSYAGVERGDGLPFLPTHSPSLLPSPRCHSPRVCLSRLLCLQLRHVMQILNTCLAAALT